MTSADYKSAHFYVDRHKQGHYRSAADCQQVWCKRVTTRIAFHSILFLYYNDDVGTVRIFPQNIKESQY